MIADQYQVTISAEGVNSVISRRAFVGRLAAGATVACAAGIGRAEALSVREESETSAALLGEGQSAPQALQKEVAAAPSAPGPWELLSPLTAGATVGYGWRVTELSAVTNGSCVLTLENARGRAHRVHLCGNAGQPQGLVFTNQLDLLVMNGGQGDLPTEEGFAQAVAEVAHVLASNEGRETALLAGLLPHAERLSQFTAAAQLR